MKKFLSMIAILSLVFLPVTPASAADGAWNVDASGNWIDAGNWNPAAVPGAVSPGILSTDKATFSAALSEERTITVDGGRNIKFIDFGSASEYGYILEGGSIALTNGGIIQTLAGDGDHTNQVNCNIVIQGDGGGAAFTADALSESNRLTFEGAISGVSSVGNSTTLTLNGSSITENTIYGAISDGTEGGTVSVSKSGTGTWRLLGDNTYTGKTIISGGWMEIGDESSLGGNPDAFTADQLTLNGGTLVARYSEAITLDDANRGITIGAAGGGIATDGTALTINNIIAGVGAGTLTFSGSGGDIVLTGANTYTGATLVDAGILSIQNSAATGTTAGGVVAGDDAELQLYSDTGIAVGVEALSIGGSGLFGEGALRNIGGDNSWAGNIVASAATVGVSDGTLTLSGAISGDSLSVTSDTDSGKLILTGANSYTNATEILEAGYVNIRNSAAFGTSEVSVADGGTIELQGGITVANTLNLYGRGRTDGQLINVSGNNECSGTMSLYGADHYIDSDAGTLTLSGLISGGDVNLSFNSGGAIGTVEVTTNGLDLGAGGVSLGGGTLILSAANTYTGATAVNAGTLNVTGSIEDSSLTTVQTAGTLMGTGTTGALTIASGGTLAPGASPGTLSTVGDVTYAAGGTYTWEINNATGVVDTNWDLHDITGGLTITSGVGTEFTIAITSLTLGNVAGDAANFNKYDNYTWVIASTTTGITGFDALDFTLDDTAFQNDISGDTNGYFGISLSGDTLDLQLTYTAAVNTPPNPIYWKGDTSGAWNLHAGDGTTNWVDGTGAEADALPDATSDVHFYYTGAGNLTTTLGEDFTIDTLTMDAGTNAVIIGGNTLTLANAGNAITLAATAGALTINSAVVLGASQSWMNNSTNDLTVTGNVTNGANLLTVTGGGDTTISGDIGNGAGGLTKTGAGTLTLSGTNTYTGTTTLTAGTLRAETDAAALGAGALVLNGGILQLASDAPTDFGRATTVGGDVTIESDTVTAATAGVTQTLGTLSIGANTLTVNQGSNATGATSGLTFGATTLTGAATINSNTIGLTTLGAVTGTGHGLTVTGAGNTTLSGGLNTSTAGTLTKSGTGTLTLTSAGDYTGATTVSAGVLRIKNDTATGTVAGGVSVAMDAALEMEHALAMAVGAEALTLSGTGVAGGGALRNIGGDNSWAGAVTLGNAEVRINSDADSLTLSGGITGAAKNLTVGGAGDTTISGIIGTTTGTLTKDGAGTLTLSGANTYTGTTAITAGTLVDAGSIADTSNVTVNGATAVFDLGNNHSDTVGTVTLQGGGQITGTGTSALTSSTDYAMQNGSVTAILAGTGGLNKTTADTVTLSGANTFTGATAVSGGALTLSGTAGAIAASSGVAISGGSTLNLTNTDVANNTDRLKDTGTVTMNGGTLNFSNNAGAVNYSETTGALTIASGVNTISTSQAAAGQTSTLTFASITHTAGTINFTGTGLGVNAQNKIMFATGAATTLGAWATYNGTGFASYDEALGVIGATYVDIDARGPSTIVDGSTTNVRILGDGTAGNIALGSATTTINTLLQSNSDFAATVDTADKTLRVGSIMIGTGKEALTLGAAVGDGTLTAATAGGELILINNSDNDLTINAVVANHTSASSLTTDGTGVVTLAGANTYTGTTTVQTGTLALGNVNAVQNSTLDVGISGAQSVTFTVGGTNTYNLGGLQGADALALGANTISVGANNANTTFSGVLSGTGGLTKVGTGTLTLSGVNTYTGKTALNAGTVKIAAESGLGGDPGGFAADQLSFDGGTLQTTVTFSIDDANRGITLGAGGGTFSPDNGTILTIANVITGTGDLTMMGTGTLALTGDNTYTGVTTFTAGTLSVATIGDGGVAGDLGAATAAAGNLVFNGGTLQYAGGDASTDRNFTINAGKTATISVSEASTELTMSGAAAAGDGALTKTGAGTLILTGANANTGITTISAGTLQVGNGVTSGAISSGNIVDNAALVFNQNGAFAVANSISGTGSLTHAGTGALSLNGVNSYTGATIVSSTGTLNVTTGLASSALNFTGDGTVNVTDGKSLGAVNNTAGGSIGTLNFLGASTVGGIFGGTNHLFDVNMAGLVTSAYDISATTINIGTNGTLRLTGDIATEGTLTTEAAATSTLDLQSYTLDHTGALTFGDDSTLNVAIDGATYGNADVTGAVTLSQNVAITVNAINPSTLTGAPLLVIDGTAGSGVAGGNEVTDNSYVWSFAATTDEDHQDLFLNPTREHPLNTVSTNSNVQAVGAALEGARTTTNSDMLSVLNTLDNMGTAQEITQSLETMMPDVSSGAMQGTRSLNSHFLTAISNRLSYARSGAAMTGIATGDMFQGTGFWMQGLGGHARQGTREGIEGFTANTFGTTIGFDKIITEHLRLGIAGGYGFGSINSKTPGSPHTNINSWQGTIYGSLDSTDLWKIRRDREFSKRSVRSQGDRLWYMDAALSFAQNFYDSKRDIWVGPADQRQAKADHGGQQYSTQFEAGYTFMFAKTRSLEVTPFTTLSYNYLRMNKYSETGADALNLHVNGQGFNQLEQGLGLKLAYPFLSQKMGTFIPSIKGAWRFDYIADEFQTLASFDGGGPAFSTIGVRPARNAFLLGGEMAFLNDGNMTITGNVDWELRDQYSGFTYYLTVRFDF